MINQFTRSKRYCDMPVLNRFALKSVAEGVLLGSLAYIFLPIITGATVGLIYAGKEIIKNKIIGKSEEKSLKTGKLSEKSLVKKLKSELIAQCDLELSYRDNDDEDKEFYKNLKKDVLKWKSINDLEKSKFNNLAEVKRVIMAYRKAQRGISDAISFAKNNTNNVTTHDSMPWSGKKHKDVILGVLAGISLAGVIALIVRSLRGATKQVNTLEQKAENPNYVSYVEMQMRNGVYNEMAVVNNLKAQIIPILEKTLRDGFANGDLSRKEINAAQREIASLKSATTLEDLYDIVKDPAVAREISAYRLAREKLKNEMASMQVQIQNIQKLQDCLNRGAMKR